METSARQAGGLTVHATNGDKSLCGVGGPWILVGEPVTCEQCRSALRAQLHDQAAEPQ